MCVWGAPITLLTSETKPSVKFLIENHLHNLPGSRCSCHMISVCLQSLSRMRLSLERLKQKKISLFVIIYLAFFLDNVLLTVVVPIIPDYLFTNDINKSEIVENTTRIGPESLSPLQKKYQILESDNGPLGALLASKAFVQLASTPVIGYLTQIFGCNVLFLLGSCNMFVAAILFAYGNSYGVLVLARALHGSSSAAIGVSGMTSLAKNVPIDLRPKLMPLAFGGIALGVLIGYPLGGAAYQLLGKTAPFLLIAFLIFICIVLQLFYVEEEIAGEEEDKKDVDYLQWFYLLHDKQILITTLCICICTSTMAIIEPCVPMWLLAHMNPPPSRWQLGAIFIPDSIGYLIGSHLTGLLPVAPWRVALSSLVLAGLSCCALPSATSLSDLGFPHFGVGLSVGAVDAALVPFLANLVDKTGNQQQYGPVYALQQMFVSLAYAFGPLLGGETIHILGFPWLMRLIGFLNLLFCPLLLELQNSKEGLMDDISVQSYSTFENTNSSTEEATQQ